MVGHALREAGGATAHEDGARDREGNGHKHDKPDKRDARGRDAVVLGSGNLGLVYLMEADHRLTVEELALRHPNLVPVLREHPHIGWVLVRSAEHGPMVLGPGGSVRLADGHVEGTDPLAPFGPGAAAHLRRTDGFDHAPDVLIGSFYDPELEEGCAFEELISFHGGLGGPQTEAFVVYPAQRLTLPPEPLVGAAAVHALLAGWRMRLQTPQAAPPAPAATAPARADGARASVSPSTR
jgi:hypothetical protein